jgi:hypothetical protein
LGKTNLPLGKKRSTIEGILPKNRPFGKILPIGKEIQTVCPREIPI